MPSTVLLDIAGRRRSPATLPTFHAGRPPHNKGLRHPADPPTVEEIIAVMHAAGDDAEGVRLRGLIVVLWRAGLRVSEALALAESDLDSSRGAILVRHGRAVSVARSAWTAGESAGINRHGEGDENALHRRRSESRWP
jgi:site-specific recombinase XerC